MSDIIQYAKHLAELKVPPLRAEITVHEDEDPRYTDDCLVQIIEKDDEYSIWYEEEHGGYEHGKKHFAHVFAAAPEFTDALAEETYEYAVEEKWLTNDGPVWRAAGNRWHLSMSAAQSDAVQYCQTRIVRRRVSPPEVINE